MLADYGNESLLVRHVETLLEYQHQPADDAGGAGDEGHYVPLASRFPLLSGVGRTDTDLYKEEHDQGETGNDEVPVIEDVVVVFEGCPVD